MGLSYSRRDDAHTDATAKSSSLPGIFGDLPLNRGLPRDDYIQRLIERFRDWSSPECMRRVTFGPDETSCEYASASYHLPGAYVKFFPCPQCTYKDEDGRTSFVEVFHFPNVHEPSICATVTFVMPADAMLLQEPRESRVEVEFTKGCPNAPVTAVHSQRSVLHISADIFVEVLRFMPRSELEKLLLVSRRWSNVIRRAKGSLQQRRNLYVMLKFYGESPGMLSIHFVRVHLGQCRILRVLTTRGFSQALNAIHSHMRNAFVDVVPFFLDNVPPPVPPRDMLVNIPLPVRIDWLKSLLRSMPPNSEIGAWDASDDFAGSDNLLALAGCALEPHRKLGCVQRLRLGLLDGDAT
ncbi:hypothetical protein AAVH_35893, partial [Aphelenchoides avenae]